MDISPPSSLSERFNVSPARKDWFEESTEVRGIEAERRHRMEKLAGAYRIFAQLGFGQGLAGHITARDPEYPECFWVNPWGVHFSQICVSDLMLVNKAGEIVIGKGPLNRAAFAIHSAIHEAQPNAVAAAHTHSTYGKAWSTLKRKLDPLTQDACVFFEDHDVFDDYTGVVLDTSEGDRIAEILGDKKGVILANHGILTAGPTVEAAAWWYIMMENVCHTQLLAEAAGTPKLISDEVARLTHGQIGRPAGAAHSFDSLYNVLLKADPSFLE